MKPERLRTIDHLRAGHCRYITGEALGPLIGGGAWTRQALYCCEPVAQGSYCAEHAARCYQPGTARWLAPPSERAIQRAAPKPETIPTLCDLIA